MFLSLRAEAQLLLVVMSLLLISEKILDFFFVFFVVHGTIYSYQEEVCMIAILTLYIASKKTWTRSICFTDLNQG